LAIQTETEKLKNVQEFNASSPKYNGAPSVASMKTTDTGKSAISV